jgi:hypothetical protein
MMNTVQARGRNDQKYLFLPDHIWKQMSNDETKCYKDTWSNRKDLKPKDYKGMGYQYPRLRTRSILLLRLIK